MGTATPHAASMVTDPRGAAQPICGTPRPCVVPPPVRWARFHHVTRLPAGPSRSRRPALAAAVTGLLGLALVVPAAAQARAVPEAGSDGMGDPYFPLDGNGGIDVVEYDIHDAYRYRDGRLQGRTGLTDRATQDLSSFNLDLLLPTRSVTVNGEPASFERPNDHELEITPSTPIADGDTFRVRVAYSGRPGRIAWDGERSWLADRREVVTMNEPHMAAWWFPANDHPRDKALMDIRITVPQGKQVIANGHLLGRTVRDGRATTRWRAREPMAPYNAFFAAGDFAVASGRTGGLPWYTAVSRSLSDEQRRVSMSMLKRSAGIVRWLESDLGDYPFSTTGGVVTGLSPGFALENQTRPTYEALSRSSTWLMVHELAHQWFGDSVSVENWHDIWLNEGPATFFEARYRATHGGRSTGTWLDRWYEMYDAGSSFWNLSIADPGAKNLFDWAVYLRGGMTLQALRQRIGDEDFWTVLRRWVSERRDGNGSTEQFAALAEQVSGEDLQAFFEAWVRAEEKPADTAANGLG